MKVLIVSDTHGNAAQLYRMLQREEDAQALIFLGDGLRDLAGIDKARPHLRVYSVRGNCDYSCFEPAEGLAAFDGLLFFYTHGHGYEVKWTLTPIKTAARQRGADVVLFGHTHVPYYEYENGLYVFNPGSLGHPRAGKPTYGVVSGEKGRPRFEHREL
ncbi:MAG: metallophosphoesterase [Oscillospiraceae bacterium]|nr:metallophosphoesterase [Oscillospiraceae bacterium]